MPYPLLMVAAHGFRHRAVKFHSGFAILIKVHDWMPEEWDAIGWTDRIGRYLCSRKLRPHCRMRRKISAAIFLKTDSAILREQ